MNNDISSFIERVTDEVVNALNNPSVPAFEPSPLVHGVDSRLAAEAFLARAEGDRRLALALLREDHERRFPGFKAISGAPGWKSFDRVRHVLYSICKERAKH